MDTLKYIQDQSKEADRLARDVTIRLNSLLPPGTAIEFKHTNMKHIENGTVIRVCTFQGLGVILRNNRTGKENKVLISNLVYTATKSTKPIPVNLEGPHCPDCVKGLPPGQDRFECGCGNVLVKH